MSLLQNLQGRRVWSVSLQQCLKICHFNDYVKFEALLEILLFLQIPGLKKKINLKILLQRCDSYKRD